MSSSAPPLIPIRCFETVVKNTSGAGRFFGLRILGRKGKWLDADQEFRIPGDILARATSLSISDERDYRTLERLIEDGDLTVIQRPTPILADESGAPKGLAIDEGTVIPVDPCYVN